MSAEVHLAGSKVRIDDFVVADLTDAYVRWLNDPQVVRFSNQRFRMHTIDSCRAYLASFTGSSNSFLSIKTLDGRAIGTMSIYCSVPHGTADIGIMIGDRGFWNGGYGQEAWNLMVEWRLGRPNIRKVTAGTLDCNIGMIRLMERSGMVLEGVRHRQELVEGEPHDVVYYGRFADEGRQA